MEPFFDLKKAALGVAALAFFAGCMTAQENANHPAKTASSADITADMLDSAQLAHLKSVAAEAAGTIPESLSVHRSSLSCQDMEFSLQGLLDAETRSESGSAALAKKGQTKVNGWNIPQSSIPQIRVCNSVSGLAASTIQTALNEWNSTGGNIGFRLVATAPCDITIQGVSGTSFSVEQYPVQAEFGVSRVGRYIRVVSDFGTRYAIGNQVLTLMHALGHTIGFGHANSAEEFTARHIAGTPTNDNYSIMAAAIWYTWVSPPFFSRRNHAIRLSIAKSHAPWGQNGCKNLVPIEQTSGSVPCRRR